MHWRKRIGESTGERELITYHGKSRMKESGENSNKKALFMQIAAETLQYAKPKPQRTVLLSCESSGKCNTVFWRRETGHS